MSRKVISLDAHGPNLLTDDAWESIIPEVPFARDGDTFECPAAPEGVAVIDKPDEKVEAGACQTVVLNQKSPQVIVASVWSKSEEAFRMLEDRSIAKVRATPPAPGFERVLIPGDPERLKRAERERTGVSIADGTWKSLQGVADQLGVADRIPSGTS